jgi:membrane fusion protein (multidrug efflux system)
MWSDMTYRLTATFRIGALLLPVALFSACGEKEPPATPPPPKVKVAAALARDVPVYVEAIGETRGNTEIEIRARVEGFVESIDFDEGSFVGKGQLLYVIDPRPFEASLAQATARLAEAEAELARLHQDVMRYQPLAARNAIPREQYETAVAYERAQTSVVEAARALVQSAELDLSYTRVVAPDAGLAGKTEVYPGTLVGRGQSTLLTRISKIDPIHARLTIPERDYLYYARSSKERKERRGDDLPFELVLADATVHPHPGRLVFIDRNVDPTTGTILLEAAFPNPDAIVRPGQFARVRAPVDLQRGAVLVPQRAVQELQGIYNVAVVGADDKIEMRAVEVSERIGSLWVIDSGLMAGERVVVDGLQKIRPGVQVEAEMVEIDSDGSPGASGEAQVAAGS